jgi:CDGSH-type Zn-finger protein
MRVPEITVGENGSYIVTGDVPLVRIRKDGTVIDTYATGAEPHLCRCGGSSAKPFCSGAHNANGFDGTETAPTDNYADRAKDLGHGILDDRAICAHAGFCANRITNVWKAAKDPELAEQARELVARCPSGALTLADANDELPPRIAVEENGPLHVEGRITVRRADGEPFEARNRILLCRCGQSKNKPLCDGSHKEVGFEG